MIDEESRAKLHKKLVADKRYTKSYDDFNKQFSNEESRVNLHNKLVEDKNIPSLMMNLIINFSLT